MTHKSKWFYEYIQLAKDLETKLERESPKLSDAVASCTDCFYPQDAVKEILLDDNGTVNGEVPPLSEVKDEYYYCENMNGEYSFCDVKDEHIAYLEQQLLEMKFWIPHVKDREDLHFSCYQQGEYETRPLYFMEIPLGEEQQSELTWKFREWYEDTEQDIEQFGTEFYLLIAGILDGRLVLNPKCLLIEEVLDEYLEMIPEDFRQAYRDGIYYTKEGFQPVPFPEDGKKAGFYAVLVKKSWIRNMEIYQGKKKAEGFERDDSWRVADLAGFSGFYLAESSKAACRDAVKIYGHSLESLMAIDLNKIVSGDLHDFKKYLIEM